MKILAITQARVGSSRLPAKVLKEIEGITLLEIHLTRILKSRKISKLKVATTTEPDAVKIEEICKKIGIEVYKGSLNNVLERFYYTALPENPDIVVRLTSDCPLIDSEVIDRTIELLINENCDYVANALNPRFPDGLDVEAFRFSALIEAFQKATLSSDKEHVTPYIWRNSTFKGGNRFVSKSYEFEKDFSNIRLTVDEPEDFELIKILIQHLGTDRPWMEYVSFLESNKAIMEINKKFVRNEGYIKSLNKDKKE